MSYQFLRVRFTDGFRTVTPFACGVSGISANGCLLLHWIRELASSVIVALFGYLRR